MTELRQDLMLDKIRSAELQPYQEGRYVLRVLATTGRVTGERRVVPMAITQLARERYVCAPNRRRDWVRNLLAAGECELEGDVISRHRAVLVEDVRAAHVVSHYLGVLGRVSDEWPFIAGAGVDQIGQHVRDIAVFRLEPLTS